MIIFENLERLLYIADIHRRDGNYDKALDLILTVAHELAKPIDFSQVSGIIEDEKRYNHNHDPKTGKFTSAAGVDNSAGSGIIETGSENVSISAIELPIEQQHTGKGNPNAIVVFDTPLNNRQRKLLDNLPEYDSRVVVPKKSVNMADLSALTAKTGDEYAMFTKGTERLVVRGNATKVNIDVKTAVKLADDGYRWSGHTHPGIDDNCMIASPGDYIVLDCFKQKTSVVYNSKGQFRTFEKED